jgi:capsular polysaccharide biosynthesis protein
VSAAPLRDVAEKDVLPLVASDALRATLPAYASYHAERAIPEAEIQARIAGHVAGIVCPPFSTGEGGALEGETLVCRARNVYALPRFGVVIRQDGGVFRLTAGEARNKYPDLAGLPGVTATPQDPVWSSPDSCETLTRANVFLAFGGLFNYGHFLLDCLTSLLAMEEAGLDAPALAPPLKRWQREFLALAFPAITLHETRSAIVRLEEAAFASPMHHFLHRPNALIVRLRDRLLASAPSGRGVKRVYLSRRGLAQRYMIGERALEADLARRGFTVARPETMSVADQIALVRNAQTLIAPAGAALANALFLPPGAQVFEIQPVNFASQWVRQMCAVTSVEWFGYFCASPAPEREAPALTRLRWAPRKSLGAYHFAYAPPLSEMLAFLDANLSGA